MIEERTETIALTHSDRPDTGPSATLLVIEGPGVGKRFALSDAPAVAGRQASCGVFIESVSVSRQHARFELSDTQFRIVDLKSKNGTFVNGERITARTLEDGDIIKLGKAVLKFVQGASAESRYLISLSNLSTTDPLTGVANRRGFDEALKAELERSEGSGGNLALILLDIDHFKAINDLYGHPAGDAVLKRIGEVLQEQVRETDLVARVGGEEFAVLCTATSERGAIRLAERIRAAIEEAHTSVEGRSLRVTASLGVACRRGHQGSIPSELYRTADQHLYRAKRSGRNRVATDG